MSHENDAKEKKKKLPYEKPQIVDIDLLAEEVLAVGCKTVTGGGAGIPNVNCETQGCISIGS